MTYDQIAICFGVCAIYMFGMVPVTLNLRTLSPWAKPFLVLFLTAGGLVTLAPVYVFATL